VTAFGLLHNLFENVLHGEAGAEERHSLAMHHLQEVSAGAIDAGDVFQVDRNGAAGLRGARRLPATLEFRRKCASQSTFYFQNYGIGRFLDFDLYHWVKLN
jgi:hypothetical protein